MPREAAAMVAAAEAPRAGREYGSGRGEHGDGAVRGNAVLWSLIDYEEEAVRIWKPRW